MIDSLPGIAAWKRAACPAPLQQPPCYRGVTSLLLGNLAASDPLQQVLSLNLGLTDGRSGNWSSVQNTRIPTGQSVLYLTENVCRHATYYQLQFLAYCGEFPVLCVILGILWRVSSVVCQAVRWYLARQCTQNTSSVIRLRAFPRPSV